MERIAIYQAMYKDAHYKEAISLDKLTSVVHGFRDRMIPIQKTRMIQSDGRSTVNAMKGKPFSINKNVPDPMGRDMMEGFDKSYINKNRGLMGELKGEKGELADKLRSGFTALNPTNKRVSNQMTNLHEYFETATKNPNHYSGFTTHMSPAVLLKENNALRSLPEEAAGAKNLTNGMRNSVGENKALDAIVGGKPISTMRLSRHNIKRVVQKHEADGFAKNVLEESKRWDRVNAPPVEGSADEKFNQWRSRQ